MALLTTSADKDAQVARDSVRQQLNALVAFVYYFILCRLSGNALPALAIGTTVQKVKTVNSINYFVGGVPKTKAGTDDLFVLAGTNVTTGNTQKYLLCLDAAGTASVVECVQAATAAGVRLVAGLLPATTKAIIGVVQVANASGVDFVPGTTSLAAAGITATYIDGLDDVVFSGVAQVVA